MDVGTCRSCKAQVWWARSVTTGKPQPLERAPENGNVVVDGTGRAHTFRDHAAAVAAMDTDESFPQGETYIAHHATCPDRGQWSSQPKKQKPKGPPAQETMPF